MNIILKREINALARAFYRTMGHQVEEGYDFSKSKHPQEKLMWMIAEFSFEYWNTRMQQRKNK